MQLIINRSKYLILALLSCSLWLMLFGNYFQIINPNPTETEEVATTNSDDTIWNSIRLDFKLDHKTNSAPVQAEIHKLLADQDKLNKILAAAGPYIYYIYNQTQQRNLPAELALIPVIESEFNPNDHSKKGATGLWQLMPETAHELGINIKSNYDGRRNVVASTKAALAYFNDLGNMFNGNWYLAIAAYNCGQVKVLHAERRVGSKSFWNLPLPKETRCYVPKLLAVAAIITNPKKYGVQLPPIKNSPYFTELKFKKPLDLVKISKDSDININTLNALNPEYKRGMVATKGVYTLLVPVKKANLIEHDFADRVLVV